MNLFGCIVNSSKFTFGTRVACLQAVCGCFIAEKPWKTRSSRSPAGASDSVQFKTNSRVARLSDFSYREIVNRLDILYRFESIIPSIFYIPQTACKQARTRVLQ